MFNDFVKAINGKAQGLRAVFRLGDDKAAYISAAYTAAVLPLVIEEMTAGGLTYVKTIQDTPQTAQYDKYKVLNYFN